MKRVRLISFTVVLLALSAPLVMAAGNSQGDSGQVKINLKHNGWLGVYIRPMPHALAVQLSALMPAGEGILVDQVEAESPAAKAGIQAHDILLSFNDQKLYSPMQLTRLVASSPVGSKITFQLIRKGKTQTVESTIGIRNNRLGQRPSQNFRSPGAQQQQRPAPNPVPKIQSSPQGWDSFESVEVNSLSDGRYHAEVSFKGADNHTRKFTFEGKKEEILAQINSEKNLPADKRQALLNALNMNPSNRMIPFNVPGMQGNPFDDPFFNNHGFNQFFQHDPFFAQPGFTQPGFNQGTAPFYPPFMQRPWVQPNQSLPPGQR